MPAEIANITIDQQAVPMMAYQGADPWHRLGERVTDPAVMSNVDRFLEAANLDWTVSLKSMFYRHGDKSIKVPQRRAVVRDTDGQLLSTVGSDYVPAQNRVAFGVLQPALDQLGVTLETAGALGKGDRVWMLAKLPQVIEPVAGDKVEQFFLILTGHNGWTSYTARGTDVRVVCANTLSMATRGSKALINLRHVKSTAEQFDQVASMVTGLMAAAKERGESFAKLAARKMTHDEIKAYISEVLNLSDDPNPVAARRRDTIFERSQVGKGVEFAPDTAWTAFNAVTEYVDHIRPTEAKNVRTIRQANESALFGTNMKIKVRALVLAKRLAA